MRNSTVCHYWVFFIPFIRHERSAFNRFVSYKWAKPIYSNIVTSSWASRYYFFSFVEKCEYNTWSDTRFERQNRSVKYSKMPDCHVIRAALTYQTVCTKVGQPESELFNDFSDLKLIHFKAHKSVSFTCDVCFWRD